MSSIQRLEVSEAEWARFIGLRAELFADIARSLAEDGHCKSYEGHFAIERSFPNYFEDRNGDAHDWAWRIQLNCYLIGPHRHYTWGGDTFDVALRKAEIDIRAWIDGNDESRNFIEE